MLRRSQRVKKKTVNLLAWSAINGLCGLYAYFWNVELPVPGIVTWVVSQLLFLRSIWLKGDEYS